MMDSFEFLIKFIAGIGIHTFMVMILFGYNVKDFPIVEPSLFLISLVIGIVWTITFFAISVWVKRKQWRDSN